MKKGHIILGALIGILLLVTGIVVGFVLDFTPKEERLAVYEAAYEAELKSGLVEKDNLVGKDNTEALSGEREKVEVESFEASDSEVMLSDDELVSDKYDSKESVPDNEVIEAGDALDKLTSSAEGVDAKRTKEPKADVTVAGGIEKTDDQIHDNPKESVDVSDVVESSSGDEVKDAFVQEAIDEHRTEIDESDLAVGSEIYNRLDTLYILDLMDGGLTSEEEEELMVYLESELTDEEIAIALELYQKYVHLLDE